MRSFRSRVADILCAFVYRTGLLWLGQALVRRLRGGRPRILCLHRVSHPGRFRRVLRHLKRRYRVVDLATVLDDPSPGLLAVTFDDGYRDLLEAAVPALEAAEVPACFFVLSLPAPERMSEAELRDLAARPGMEVAAHGRSHRRLPDLAVAEREPEILGVREDLRRVFGEAPRFFAYPWGATDPDVSAAVRDAGYEAGFGTARGGVRPGSDRFAIPRTHVPDEAGLSRVACEAAGFLDLFRGLR